MTALMTNTANLAFHFFLGIQVVSCRGDLCQFVLVLYPMLLTINLCESSVTNAQGVIGSDILR